LLKTAKLISNRFRERQSMLEELARLDASGQADLVARGEVTALELVDAAIDRIERLNPQLNCVIFPRYEKARIEARDALLQAGAPFRGVPLLLKDLVQSLAGEPFSWGWKPLKDAGLVSPLTSHIAAKFQRAGFIILGQTTVPEWGTSVSTETNAWGITRNPWDLSRSAGGSSGGAGAAVAAALVPAAHGNDAGGSIRIPASKCGLVGMKPSRGRTSLGPLYGDFWHGLCEEGVLTRSIRDLAAIFDVIAGWMPGDPFTAPRPTRPYTQEITLRSEPLRVGIMERAPSSHPPLHPECITAVHEAAELLRALGHRVEAAFPAALDDPTTDSRMGKLIAAHEAALANVAAKWLGREVGSDDFEEWTWALIERGRRIGAAEYIAICEWMNTFSRAAAQWWTDGFDILVTPTLATPPPPLGTYKRHGDESVWNIGRRINQLLPFTGPWNITGQPALTLPLHMTADGLPVGVQFVAAYGREDLLLRLASELEEAAPWAQRVPPVHA
jgi:amidase